MTTLKSFRNSAPGTSPQKHERSHCWDFFEKFKQDGKVVIVGVEGGEVVIIGVEGGEAVIVGRWRRGGDCWG